MQNFSYRNPTRIVFGKGTIAELANLIDPSERILLLYGGGSIKKNGVWEQVHTALEGRDLTAFGGIEANPDYDTCMRAVKEAVETQRSFILAVGGGSVLDAAKFIAAAAWLNLHDPAALEGKEEWDLVVGRIPTRGALPLGTVLTLAATGSEMNPSAVISWRARKQKRAFAYDVMYPQFSVLDPQTAFSLPRRQIANGIADAFVHVAEQYLTRDIGTAVQDRTAEGIMKTLIDDGPAVLADPQNYDLQASIMWACTMALNGIIGVGTIQDWTSHGIGHELTALYGIDHGRTLAVVLPGVLEHEKKRKWAKLLMFARNVWGLSQGDELVLIDEAIARTVMFFESLGIGTRLRDYEGTAGAPRAVAEKIDALGYKLGEEQHIDGKAAEEILSLRE